MRDDQRALFLLADTLEIKFNSPFREAGRGKSEGGRMNVA